MKNIWFGINNAFAQEVEIPRVPNTYEKGMIDLSSDNLEIGTIITELLPYIYVIAGLILLLMLIAGGFGLMTAAGNPDKMKAGYGKIKSGLIGFLIIFISYIVVMIMETVLGVEIL